MTAFAVAAYLTDSDWFTQRAMAQNFSSVDEIDGFLKASPEHVSRLTWNIAAPARYPKLMVTVARGYCFGVGFELSLACDFRLVSETCLTTRPEIVRQAKSG